MLFLVTDFVVKIHIIFKLYVELSYFTFLYLKQDRGIQIVNLNVTFIKLVKRV